MVAQQTLDLLVGVRIPIGQQTNIPVNKEFYGIGVPISVLFSQLPQNFTLFMLRKVGSLHANQTYLSFQNSL